MVTVLVASAGICFFCVLPVSVTWAILLLPPLMVGIVLLARKHVKTGVAVLVSYGVLFGSFVIHAELERRSTCDHIFRWLNGEYGNHQSANDFAEDAKKVVNPSELQQWAVIILHETQPTDMPFEIPADKIPANIRNLTSDGVPFEDASYEEGLAQDPCIVLYWGGPFGHWGLCVGSQTFKIKSLPDSGYVEWKPGVYFWWETR